MQLLVLEQIAQLNYCIEQPPPPPGGGAAERGKRKW